MADAIKWLAYPFYHATEHLPKDDPRRCGALEITPYVSMMLSQPVVVPTVEPDEVELAIIKRHYPTVEPATPPWQDIKATLLAAAVPPATVHNATSLELVRMLDKVALAFTGQAGDDPRLTHVELAARFNLDRDSCRKKLGRWRSKNGDGWIEVSDTRSNEPKYLYQLSAVEHLFE